MSRGFYSLTCRAQYLETPKAACTSIKATLLLADGFEARDGNHAHCHQRWEAMPNGFAPELVFAVSRHPFDRLASAFAEKLKTGKAARLRGSCPLDPASSTFGDWCRWVCGQAWQQVDRHWAPQVFILRRAAAAARVDDERLDVWRFERLATEWLEMERRGAPPLVRWNQSPQRRPWREYFDSQALIDLAAEFYAADLEAFGYQPPEPFEGEQCRTDG